MNNYARPPRIGMFGARPLVEAPAPAATPPAPLAPQRQGPGTLRTIAGTVGDALAQMGGFAPTFAPVMQAQRQAMQQHEQALQQQQMRAAEREQDNAQWRERQAYTRANPEPRPPSEFERVLEGAGIMPGTPEYQEQMAMRARNMAEGAPIVAARGDGSFTVVPRSQLYNNRATTGPAVGTERNGFRFRGGNANDRNNWEAVGGPTPPASGRFPGQSVR